MAIAVKTEALTLAANCIVGKLMGASPATIDQVAELLSYSVEGTEFMGTTSWNGRSSFYSRRTNTFPAGFLHMVHSELKQRGHVVRIVQKGLPEPLGPENPIVDEFGNDNPKYDFQMRALRQVEKHGRGIIQVATGGGKSKIAKLIAARYRRMTMFLTTRGILMYQMKDGFESAGFNVGVIGDSVWKPVRGINVGMVQTFVSRLEPPDLQREINLIVSQHAKIDQKAIDKRTVRPPALVRAEIVVLAQERFDEKHKQFQRHVKLLELVEVVIGEEAHEAGGNSYYDILKYCKNAQIRVALTATPFMRDDAEDNMRLMAAFGPVLIKVPEKLLIDRGILATPSFKFVDSKPHHKLRRTSPWQRAYQLGYMENAYMHADIVRDAQIAAKLGMPVLTLIQRTEHGKTLERLMREAGLRVEFIQGEDDQVGRRRALHRLKTGQIDALIGTTILDVGVDVPAISLLQLAGGGKAEVALRQRIGRGARGKSSGPNRFFVAIYSVSLNIKLNEHHQTQRAIIEGTPGFVEGILAPGVDFDWSAFKKAA